MPNWRQRRQLDLQSRDNTEIKNIWMLCMYGLYVHKNNAWEPTSIDHLTQIAKKHYQLLSRENEATRRHKGKPRGRSKNKMDVIFWKLWRWGSHQPC